MTTACPELSMIIATKNAGTLLDETLCDISQSASFPFDVIIQGAMSSDTTEEVVLQHLGKLPILFASERDSGIYNAWNKALARAKGRWIVFIGAGDRLDWTGLELCVAALKNLPPGIEYYATPVQRILPDGKKLEMLLPSSCPVHNLAQGMILPHPGLFHRNTLFSRHKFDESCRIAGDYDFLCRTLRTDNFSQGKICFVSMLTGGMSGNMASMYQSEWELLRLSRKYFPKRIPLKPLLRLARSLGYLGVRRLFGSRIAGYFADIPRLAQGKPRLWSLPSDIHNPH